MFISKKTGSDVHGSLGNSLRKSDFTCRLADFSEYIITSFIPQIHQLHKHTVRESDRKDVGTPVLYNHRADLNSCVKQRPIFRRKRNSFSLSYYIHSSNNIVSPVCMNY